MPTGTSDSTSPSSNPSQEGPFRVVRKRNRIPLSCAPCRHRKLKCDRTVPCENCTRRGDVDGCTYALPNVHRRNPAKSLAHNNPEEMQGRIDRLENLVLSLMTNGPDSAGVSNANAALSQSPSQTGGSTVGSSSGFSPEADQIEMDGDYAAQPEDPNKDDDLNQVTKSVGSMTLDKNLVVFVPQSHWYSVISEIEDVKKWFQEHKKQHESLHKTPASDNPDDERSELGFLFLAERPASRAEILREFPSRDICDVLMARFFDAFSYDHAFRKMRNGIVS
jgi:hypothetical protein